MRISKHFETPPKQPQCQSKNHNTFPLPARRPIFPEGVELDISEVAQALWEAPFAVLAHDIEVGGWGSRSGGLRVQ
jgi:hypothetical protein